MEIIGFIAVLALGFYLIFGGVGLQFFYQGFAGKWSWYGLFLLCVGIALLYLAWQYSPITIEFNTK